MPNTPDQQKVDTKPLAKKTKVLQGIARFAGAMTQGVIVTLIAQFMLSVWQNPIVHIIVKSCFEYAVKTGLNWSPFALHFLVPSLVISLPVLIMAGVAYVSIDWKVLRDPKEQGHIDQPSFTIFSVALPIIGYVTAVSVGGLELMAASMLTFAVTTLASSYFIVYQQHQIDNFQRQKLINARLSVLPSTAPGLQPSTVPTDNLQPATTTSLPGVSVTFTPSCPTARVQTSSSTSAPIPQSEQLATSETSPRSSSPSPK